MNIPWVEKYRPTQLDEIVGNPETMNRLKSMVNSKSISNLILIGKSGTGKTSSIHCVARAILGTYYKQAVLEINASEERKVETVKEDIRHFCQKLICLPDGLKKIVILDEVDSMTESAQQVLRQIIETYKHSTRFALACNNSTKIIDSIQSKCNLLRFDFLKNDEMKVRLNKICELENIKSDESGKNALLFTANGDMRNLLNNLQIVHYGYNFLSEENVYKICDIPNHKIIENIILLCDEKRLPEAIKKVNELIKNGYSVQDIIETFFRVIRNNEFSEKVKYYEIINNFYIKVSEGVESKLQLYGFICNLAE